MLDNFLGLKKEVGRIRKEENITDKNTKQGMFKSYFFLNDVLNFSFIKKLIIIHLNFKE